MAKMDEATRRRVRAGRLMLAGKTPAQAASAVGVARQTAYTWKSRLDEGGIEAGLDPRDPPFVDIGLFLFPGLTLDIKIKQPLAIDHGYAQLFFLSCIDEHSLHRTLHAKNVCP